MPLDILASVRATAVIAIASASFTSPIIVKSDVVGGITERLSDRKGAQVEPSEQLVAGGYAFDVPADWGRLGPSAAGSNSGHDRGAQRALGTVVSGVCPGGSTGAACEDGVQITFVAYRGEGGAGLPALPAFEDRLDAELEATLDGFAKRGSQTRPSADGSRWLRYEFEHETADGVQHQVLGAYRHVDGTGVVAVASGPDAGHADHAEAIERFLASARELAAEA